MIDFQKALQAARAKRATDSMLNVTRGTAAVAAPIKPAPVSTDPFDDPFADDTDPAKAIADVMGPAKAVAAPAKPVEEVITMSPQQAKVWEAIKSGRNVLVTGAAGTGKSTILKRMKAEYGENGLAVVASTGIAAVNVGGLTINAWAGLGLADDLPEKIAAKIIHMEWPTVRNRIRKCMRLALDEVSMISGYLLNVIDEVFRIVRDNPAPFGGIQMIFFGDFLQLPPVVKDMEAEKHGRFAFQSQAWKNANVAVAMLTQVFRQKDAAFSQALNDIRLGHYSEGASAIFRARYCGPKAVAAPVDTNPEIKPVVIHTHNADVDEINRVELAKIEEPEQAYKSTDTGAEGPLKMLKANCLAPENLIVKVGAQVMLLWNIDPKAGMANGSVGTVVRIGAHSKLPWVKFASGMEYEIEPQTWDVRESGKILAARKQVPLRLAWAITAHKSQGMTLDKVEVHLDKAFEYGQSYVAFSRVKTPGGLYIKSGNKNCIKAHPDAVAFYEHAESIL